MQILKNKKNYFLNFLNNFLSRKYRYLILLSYDLFVVIGSTFTILDFSSISTASTYKFIFYSILLTIFIYVLTGQYRSLTRYFGSQFLYSLLLRNFILVTFILFYCYITIK